MENKEIIAREELWLNLKNQGIELEDGEAVGYEFDKGQFVFLMCLDLKNGR